MRTDFFQALPAIIQTDRLQMKRTSIIDAPALFTIWSDMEVAEYMNIEQFTTVRQAEEMIKAIEAEPHACRYTIFFNNRIIGSLGINEFNSLDNTLEVGYELAKEFWNNGFMTELLKAFFKQIQNCLTFSGVSAKVLPENTASIFLLEKLGFKLTTKTSELDLYTQNVSPIFIYKFYFSQK
ncbi:MULTISPECIES: GNAT family N-acetyltransferase [Listeria]|uniref:GNAT family N-acetyltransferase n=1 Tax=Listeria TaxID=1637 RepID=UPI000B58A2CA|nr:MULTISPECIES: GNAT family N-acetyltransferase [Listeria]